MAIRRATMNDLRRMNITAMRAFHDDPVMRWLYPDDDEYFEPNGEVFRGITANWVTHQTPWCTDDVAALAVWFPPVEPGASDPPDVELDPPAKPPSPALIKRFEMLRPHMAANTPPEPHWYLQLLATHPDWQRQGLGAELMQVVFEQADADGIPCYLETERLSLVAYYRRYGFEVRSEWDVDPDGVTSDVPGEPGPHMWGMLRPPH